jgi:hypothetical protein
MPHLHDQHSFGYFKNQEPTDKRLIHIQHKTSCKTITITPTIRQNLVVYLKQPKANKLNQCIFKNQL